MWKEPPEENTASKKGQLIHPEWVLEGMKEPPTSTRGRSRGGRIEI